MHVKIFLPLGFLFVALAVAGAVLPLLPSTPFVLLAATCFARSSEKWHTKLRNSVLFGEVLTNWECQRCVAARTKLVAILSMVFVGGFSVFYAIDANVIRSIAVMFMLIGAAVIYSLKTCKQLT